ncbi:hypothetical protein PHYSODRAFT_488527, partial [Phytophthora sojae]
VVFAPEKEVWLKAMVYKTIGSAYTIGRLCGRPKKVGFAALNQVGWSDSKFQSAVEQLGGGR